MVCVGLEERAPVALVHFLDATNVSQCNIVLSYNGNESCEVMEISCKCQPCLSFYLHLNVIDI